MSLLKQIITAKQRFSGSIESRIKQLLKTEDFSKAMKEVHTLAVEDSNVLSIADDLMSEDQQAIYRTAHMKWEIDSCELILGDKAAFYPVSIDTLQWIYYMCGWEYEIFRDDYFKKDMVPKTCARDFIYSLRPCLGELMDEYTKYQTAYTKWYVAYSHAWKDRGITYEELCEEYQVNRVGHCPYLPFPLTLSGYIKDVSKYWKYRKIVCEEGLFIKHRDELDALRKKRYAELGSK